MQVGRTYLDTVQDGAAEAIQPRVDVVAHKRLRLLYEVLNFAGSIVNDDTILGRLCYLGDLRCAATARRWRGTKASAGAHCRGRLRQRDAGTNHDGAFFAMVLVKCQQVLQGILARHVTEHGRTRRTLAV